MNLITMVPATARFIAQMRGMRRHIVENNVTEFAVFQNWCDENNERWAEALVLGFRASRKPRRKGMGKGAAAPPFPCLFCSRTDRISVLTGQGRSSSCKIWEVGTQSPLTWTFQPSSILLPSGFRSLDGRALSLEKTGNLGFPVFCSQQSDYPISCHLQMAAAQFAISVLRIMERRELRDA